LLVNKVCLLCDFMCFGLATCEILQIQSATPLRDCPKVFYNFEYLLVTSTNSSCGRSDVSEGDKSGLI
jgi:hypothetical protein